MKVKSSEGIDEKFDWFYEAERLKEFKTVIKPVEQASGKKS